MGMLDFWLPLFISIFFLFIIFCFWEMEWRFMRMTFSYECWLKIILPKCDLYLVLLTAGRCSCCYILLLLLLLLLQISFHKWNISLVNLLSPFLLLLLNIFLHNICYRWYKANCHFVIDSPSEIKCHAQWVRIVLDKEWFLWGGYKLHHSM